MFEAHAEIRRIYLGERAKEEDLFPDRNGYSVGRWDGDKLIVETTHLKEAVDQAALSAQRAGEDRRGVHARDERRRHARC